MYGVHSTRNMNRYHAGSVDQLILAVLLHGWIKELSWRL